MASIGGRWKTGSRLDVPVVTPATLLVSMRSRAGTRLRTRAISGTSTAGRSDVASEHSGQWMKSRCRETVMALPDDRKYTDEDVRGNVELLHLAWQYAGAYHGDWDVMVAARYLAMERSHTEDLPVAVARMVLNTMRADP